MALGLKDVATGVLCAAGILHILSWVSGKKGAPERKATTREPEWKPPYGKLSLWEDEEELETYIDDVDGKHYGRVTPGVDGGYDIEVRGPNGVHQTHVAHKNMVLAAVETLRERDGW